jgi:hypothetical protein
VWQLEELGPPSLAAVTKQCWLGSNIESKGQASFDACPCFSGAEWNPALTIQLATHFQRR